MEPLLSAALAILVISLISLVGIATLSLREDLLRRGLFLVIALAAGALLGDAFIHLIPEAFEESGSPLTVSLLVLAGIFTFFILEKVLNWHHSHGDDEFSPDHARIHPVGKLVLVSDGIHNLLDGAAIGAAFMISPEIGVATTIAIALHELPQEVGDFGLLVHSGFTRMQALVVNFLSALTAFIGLGLVFLLGDYNEGLVPYIAAFTAGFFIYIAMSDIIPELQKTKLVKQSVLQVLVIAVGVAAMVGLLSVEGPGHGDEEEHAGELVTDEHLELKEAH